MLTISSISNYFFPTAQCVSHRPVTAKPQTSMLYNLIILQCCFITYFKYGHWPDDKFNFSFIIMEPCFLNTQPNPYIAIK
jgi:hypothetical protein